MKIPVDWNSEFRQGVRVKDSKIRNRTSEAWLFPTVVTCKAPKKMKAIIPAVVRRFSVPHSRRRARLYFGLLMCLFAGEPAVFGQDALHTVVERAANHRVIERSVTETLPDGGTYERRARVTELATSMHFQRGGVWLESNPRLTVLTDGSGATATDLPFQLHLPADLYNGAIVLVTPEGERLVSRPAGLVYSQGTNQWLAASLKECTGELLPDGTGVIWRDAFDGVNADVVALCSTLAAC
jgi:hypothetical protein